MTAEPVGREPPPQIPADLRLLPAAGGSWLGDVFAGVLPLRICWWLAAAALLVGALVVRRRPAAAVALVLMAAALSITSIGRQSRASGPVADLARRGGVRHIELTVSSDPQLLPARPHLDRSVIVLGEVRRLDVDGRSWHVDQPVIVLAPAASWGDLLPSTRVAVSADLQKPEGTDVAAVAIVRRAPLHIRGPSGLQEWAGRIRSGLRAASAGLPASEAGLLPGLVVGDTSRIPAADTADFKTAGLSHLTAVSGTNLAIVVAVMFGLLSWTPLGIRMRAATSAVALVGFVVLARPSPSVLRAAAMGLLALLAVGLGRPRALLPSLLAAVTALLLFRPTLAVQPGFALSVLATLALLVLTPGWTARLRMWLPDRLGRLAPFLAAPLAAQVACAPVIAGIGGGVSIVAIPANLLALPAVAVTTMLGLTAALLSQLSTGAAALLCTIARWPCWWLVRVARVAAHSPLATLTAPSGVLGVLVVSAASVALVAAMKRVGGRRVVGLSVLILLAAQLGGLR
jgi:competence protein ComEC